MLGYVVHHAKGLAKYFDPEQAFVNEVARQKLVVFSQTQVGSSVGRVHSFVPVVGWFAFLSFCVFARCSWSSWLIGAQCGDFVADNKCVSACAH